jgi:hypothetical protein
MEVSSVFVTRILRVVSGRRDLEDSVFASCTEQYPGGNSTVLLKCVSDSLEAEDAEPFSNDMVDFLLVVTGALIFFMQTGFAMLCAGSVQLKNVQNTMLKNLLDACGSAIAFFLIGKCTGGGIHCV